MFALHMKKWFKLRHLLASPFQKRLWCIIMLILDEYGLNIPYFFPNHYRFHQMLMKNLYKNTEIFCINTFTLIRSCTTGKLCVNVSVTCTFQGLNRLVSFFNLSTLSVVTYNVYLWLYQLLYQCTNSALLWLPMYVWCFVVTTNVLI